MSLRRGSQMKPRDVFTSESDQREQTCANQSNCVTLIKKNILPLERHPATLNKLYSGCKHYTQDFLVKGFMFRFQLSWHYRHAPYILQSHKSHKISRFHRVWRCWRADLYSHIARTPEKLLTLTLQQHPTRTLYMIKNCMIVSVKKSASMP